MGMSKGIHVSPSGITGTWYAPIWINLSISLAEYISVPMRTSPSFQANTSLVLIRTLNVRM